MTDKLKAFLSILSLFAIFIVISMLVIFVWAGTAGIEAVNYNVMEFFYLCVIMLLLYFYSKSQDINLWKSETTFTLKWVIFSVTLGVLFALFMLVFFKYMNHLPTHKPTYTTFGFIYAEIISIGILVPFVEEYCFRKWIVLYMEKHDFSKYTIILVSSILFYLWHQNFVSFDKAWRVDTIVIGIVQCLLFMKTRNIYYCIIAHGVANVSLDALEYQLLF